MSSKFNPRRLAGGAIVMASLALPATALAAVVPANSNWGIVDRNTIGSPSAQLRTGPATPPLGLGSLNFTVANGPATGNPDPDAEKIAYGDEVDYRGVPLASINQVGFSVYTTGEDSALGNPNMPSIAFEIDPNLNATPSNFSTLVFVPTNNSASNAWTAIDATNPAMGSWFLTGPAGTFTNCTLATPCTYDQARTALAPPNGTGATLLTAQVTKGRDFAWQGAIDAFVIGDSTIDFELPTNTGPVGAAGPAGPTGAAGAAAPATVTNSSGQSRSCSGAQLRTLHAPSRRGERFVSTRATLRGSALKVKGRVITVDLRTRPQGNNNIHITSRYRTASGKTRTVKTTRTLAVFC